MQESIFDYAHLSETESNLVFSSFSRADAAMLGSLMDEEAKKVGCPIAMEIVINNLVVYRYFQDGCPPDSTLWLQRKRNVVELMHMGSLRYGCFLAEVSGESLADRKLNPDDYAPGGGGMPIILKGTGVIGSVCVSGCPDHLDDQRIVTNGLQRLLEAKE